MTAASDQQTRTIVLWSLDFVHRRLEDEAGWPARLSSAARENAIREVAAAAGIKLITDDGGIEELLVDREDARALVANLAAEHQAALAEEAGRVAADQANRGYLAPLAGPYTDLPGQIQPAGLPVIGRREP